MNTFKKKSLHAAVLAGLGAIGAVGTAEAVHINPDGQGQVLIYPYYTSRASQFTAISVVNTTSQFKAVKVRFLEGKNSREVLDFNLFLSPFDVWTGGVTESAAGTGARVVTNDNSCVTPSDLFTEARTDNGQALNAFKNYAYTGANVDVAALGSLDRTREGYFEMIEMGIVTTAAVQAFIKHGTNGVPANCAALDTLDPGFITVPALGFFSNVNHLLVPTGGLAGRASIINGATGVNYTYEPTAVDQWTNAVNYTRAGFETPSLSEVFPRTSNVFTNGGVVNATWAAGRDAMSAIMMRDTLMNEFILDSATASLTDWVITFPTKRDYITTTTFAQPFSAAFATTAGACDPYGVAVYNREEGAPGAAATTILPSPRPPVVTAAGSNLCWEANVVPFGASSLLGSTNTNTLVSPFNTFVTSATTTPGSLTTPALRSTQGPNGWLLMSFQANLAPAIQRTIAPTAATINGVAAVSGVHVGLPVIGAMFHNYNRAGVVSTYGGVVGHRYTRQILP